VLSNSEDPAILLIICLGACHILRAEDLPNWLVEAGYYAVLFDNRDVGKSQRLNKNGNLAVWWECVKSRMNVKVNAPYDLKDMANDRISLLNELQLQLQRAHSAGAFMDDIIAWVVAAQHPERVISLTSIISRLGLIAHNLPSPR
jgi:pimeloyl-ACP methyl ester carboxylesterase